VHCIRAPVRFVWSFDVSDAKVNMSCVCVRLRPSQQVQMQGLPCSPCQNRSESPPQRRSALYQWSFRSAISATLPPCTNTGIKRDVALPEQLRIAVQESPPSSSPAVSVAGPPSVIIRSDEITACSCVPSSMLATTSPHTAGSAQEHKSTAPAKNERTCAGRNAGPSWKDFGPPLSLCARRSEP
jgi:hypothetical protein